MNLLTILLDGAPEEVTKSDSSSVLIMLGAMALVFYFFMIRPQQKRQKELAKFRDELRTGSKVMTVGGIHGTVVSKTDNTVIVAIAQGVEIAVEKSCIVADSSDIQSIEQNKQ